MGYRPTKKIYNLTFVDYPGLEIAATGTSLGKLLYLSNLNIRLSEPDDTKRMEVFNFFASRLVTWNMEHPDIDDETELELTEDAKYVCKHCKTEPGAVMPCSVTSLMCLEVSFVQRIIYGWMGALATVSTPKGMSSSDGERNIEEAMLRLAQLQSPNPLLEQS